MTPSLTKAEAKAAACSYLLLCLLQRMDRQEPGLIEGMLAGVRGDQAGCSDQPDLSPVVTQIFEQAIALLERANAYKINEANQPAVDE